MMTPSGGIRKRLTTQIPNNPHIPLWANPPLWEPGLPAMAACLIHLFRQCRRHRGQARLPHFELCYFWRAVLSGSRAMFVASSDPKYSQSPYSRTVVIGE